MARMANPAVCGFLLAGALSVDLQARLPAERRPSGSPRASTKSDPSRNAGISIASESPGAPRAHRVRREYRSKMPCPPSGTSEAEHPSRLAVENEAPAAIGLQYNSQCARSPFRGRLPRARFREGRAALSRSSPMRQKTKTASLRHPARKSILHPPTPPTESALMKANNQSTHFLQVATNDYQSAAKP
jgi:hypothetical protein